MGQGALAKKIARTALDRIEHLETSLSQVFTAVTKTFETIESRFQRTEELLTAVVSILGIDAVQATVIENRRGMAQAGLAKAQEELAAALAKGQVVVAEAVGETSIIVGLEVDSDGQPVGYVEGRQQISINKIIPEIRAQLMGKGPGFSIDTPRKGKFTVEKVYDVIATDEAPVEDDILSMHSLPPSAPLQEDSTTEILTNNV